MAQLGFIVRALIASPSDVQRERQAIPEVIAAWNATHSYRRKIIIEPVKWESHTVPGLEGRPQEMVNKQIVVDCDFLIGAFWTRLGTPTGVALSGTVEEINEFRKLGKPVLLYFSSQPVVPASIDLKQYELLTNFQNEMEQQGLVERYEEVGELREKLTRHLTAIIDKLSESGVFDINVVGLPTQSQELADSIESKIDAFLEQFKIFIRRFAASWSGERDSEPINIDEAIYILNSADNEIVSFISTFGDVLNRFPSHPLQEPGDGEAAPSRGPGPATAFATGRGHAA